MLHVLVVEDNEHMRRAVALRIRAGFRATVDAAADVVGALRLLREARFDLAVVDLHLPGASGADLVEVLRHAGQHEGLPVLLVSGDEDALAEAAGRVGVASLAKPFTAEQLLGAVDELLVRASRP